MEVDCKAVFACRALPKCAKEEEDFGTGLSVSNQMWGPSRGEQLCSRQMLPSKLTGLVALYLSASWICVQEARAHRRDSPSGCGVGLKPAGAEAQSGGRIMDVEFSRCV